MKKELGHEAIYDARQLGTPRMLVLGLQHMFAMFGATVLVPILVQGYGLPLSIQTTLLFAGLGTLLFHVCTKMKVPAFLGSSFAYLGGFSTVATMPAYEGLDPETKLAYALGGIVIAGLLYLVLALLFTLLGAKKGKKHIISTAFEHHAVLHTLKKLEKQAQDGIIYRRSLTEETAKFAVLSVPSLSGESIEKMCSGVETDELIRIRDAFRKKAEDVIPLTPQLKAKKEKNTNTNNEFKF